MREDLRKAFDKSGKLKNWAIPMPKYEEMEAVLTDNEKVLSVIKAGINGKHVGVAILTDNGVHLLGRGTFKSLSPYNETFSLKHITGVTRQRNIMYLGFTIEISRAGNVDSLLGTDKDDSEEFVQILKRLVNEGAGSGGQTVVMNQAVDPLDQLKKLKDLLDSGILTEKEFEQKKRELMDRI
jgi:hypothetical protein